MKMLGLILSFYGIFLLLLIISGFPIKKAPLRSALITPIFISFIILMKLSFLLSERIFANQWLQIVAGMFFTLSALTALCWCFDYARNLGKH